MKRKTKTTTIRTAAKKRWREMTAEEKAVERHLTEAGEQMVEDLIQRNEISGGPLSSVQIAHALRQYGPLLYKAGAAHVFLNYDCYPKTR